MQVKKFEAKSMKEALEMVKLHLGPEAIILSARDNSHGFGLGGKASIEVTAAISEETLRKKILAETKMNAESKTKYQQSSAKLQKQFIEKASIPTVERIVRPLTTTPYIDIDEEVEASSGMTPSSGSRPQSRSNQVRPVSSAPPVNLTDKATGNDEISRANSRLAEERIRSAVQSAVSGMTKMNLSAVDHPKSRKMTQHDLAGGEESQDVKILRSEVKYLKEILEKFHKLPQSFVSMHPGAEEGIPYEMSSTYEKLTRAGISASNVVYLLKECMSHMDPINIKKRAFVDAWVAKYLLDEILVSERRPQDRFHVFLGPSGGGKTSSLVKLASHLVINEKKKVSILSADFGKVGAAEQLRIYSQILNVPFAVIRRKEDWGVIQRKLDMSDYFLVDFPGMNLKSMGEVDFVRNLLPPVQAGRVLHYVQSILANDANVFDLAERYIPLGIQDVIFTCLDESSQHGLIYNFQKKFRLPLFSFGIGPKIPEDWENATKERVVDLIFKLTKIRKI
jgi:flagellar biosynthesis protein FlhF